MTRGTSMLTPPSWCSALVPIWPTSVTGRTTATDWTRLKYAGAGFFSFEEDIYNPANFISLIQRWEAAAERAVAVPTYEFEDGKLVGPSAPTALGGECGVVANGHALIVGGNQRARHPAWVAGQLTLRGGELSTPNLDEWLGDHRYVARLSRSAPRDSNAF